MNNHIAARIPKEVDVVANAVRFMWRETVHLHGSCLLADHMQAPLPAAQVITLLVAIAETSASPTIASQIPQSLRVSKTLILGPSSQQAKEWVSLFQTIARCTWESDLNLSFDRTGAPRWG